ncbi:uncharacterized protein LOC111594775 [Drosophila hydei]|uniref:Uncharacterized protein LOC111594775 n=1 Tax=Drosophila hydei TaxID=7224 RepID=A0A6J1LEY1_DROHY|nr:uncharacterized protein LOC111594775 [Drosophila hydei]
MCHVLSKQSDTLSSIQNSLSGLLFLLITVAMPETKNNKLHNRQTSSSHNSNSNSDYDTHSGSRYSNSNASQRPQATDFTTKQQLKLRAGDLRLARLQISLAKLRLEMEHSGKLIAELCKNVEVEKNTDKKL